MDSPLEMLPCLACAHAGSASLILRDGRDYFISDGKTGGFSIAVCSQCGTGRTLPELDDAQLAAYYPASFESFQSRSGFQNLLLERKLQQDLSLLARYLRRPLRGLSLFEIGAGRGDFLAAARALGMLVAGIEPGRAGRDQACALHGLELQSGFAGDLTFERRFDVIVARHVLEHVPDPFSCLQTAAHQGLAEGGVLMLKLPRFDSWEARRFRAYWHGLDLPRHRVHFTRQGLEGLLRRVGFLNLELKDEVVPTDIARSIGYYARHAPSPGAAGAFELIPSPMRLLACQAIGTALRAGGAGRMIALATR